MGQKSEMEGKASTIEGTDNWSVPTSVKENNLFVEVESGTMLDAIYKMDKLLKERKLGHLISRKPVRPFLGVEINSGNFGLWDRNGRPVVSVKPGSYWNFSFMHKFVGSFDLTSNVEMLGLTMGQVGQSEAMVVLDPQNRVFIVRNGGFIAYGLGGRFRIAAVVDTLDLGDSNAVYDKSMNAVVGYKKEVTIPVMAGGQKTKITLATFFNVPANNVVLVQKRNELFSLGAGQHVITDPHTTFRGFFSLSERQHTFLTKPAYTVEGVPVILRLNLRYKVTDPITLARNYDDPLMALLNPCQTVINSVVSRMSYQQFMRARKVEGDIPDINDGAHWVTEFRQECLKDLREQADDYGIIVESFDVMDRELDGSLGKDLEKQAEKVLQNQIEASQVQLKNKVKAEEEKGLLAVEQVKAQTAKTKADTEYYAATKAADSKYYQTMKEASAKVESSALVSEQEAKNIIMLAEARMKEIKLQGETYGNIESEHAKNVQLSLIEVEKRKALPDKTVWFQGGSSSDVSSGFQVASGVSLAHQYLQTK